MNSALQKIPDSLVYEMVNGKPIYYRGYKEYLNGTKQLEQLIGSSKFQSFLAAELIFLFKSFLGKDYYLFSNELGLQFSKNSWRAADIAIIKKSKVKRLDSKYLSVPPEYVIEIDTKADLGEISNPLGYYQEKTQELLKFGVNKIIWIFTDTEKIMIAQKGSKKWEILDWDQEIEFLEGLKVNIHQLLVDNGLR
ncbi:MAG: hypothetical protein DHS20C18_51500 [Saprospiraceae bacterium]|nr:MAG: hypothetical protein DHS20C18_51500 [Saprospiraceae bacterium]